MAGPILRNLPRLLALFVLANGGQAFAAFIAAPSESEPASPFSVEFKDEAAAAPGIGAGEWVLVPRDDSGSEPRPPAGSDEEPAGPLVDSFTPASGAGAGQAPSPTRIGSVSVGLPTPAPRASGGALAAYLIREGRCLLPVPFQSGIFRPPRRSDAVHV